MAKIPGDGNTAPFPASDGTYDPNQISEDLRKRVDIPTIPDQPQNLPSRRGRVTEVVKEMFVWELRHYLDNVNSPDDLLPVPVIMKFASDLPNPYQELDPLETVLRIIRAFPDIMERLPYVGVVASAGKNTRLAAGGKYVAPVLSPPRLIAGTGPFTPPVGPPAYIPPNPDFTAFNDNEVPGVPGAWPDPTGKSTWGLTSSDWVEITTVVDGAINVEVFQFTDTLVGISPQSPRVIADAINFSALCCHADVVLIDGVPTLIIEPGGPVGNTGSYFEIFRSNASPNFDAYVNLPLTKLIAPSNQFPMKNRYLNSMEMTIGLIIGTDGDTLRTEITDLIQNFFAFVMNTRQFTFWGRSFYGNTPDEFYQLVIKDNEINVIGEQEIERPDDPIRKIYVNRIDIPILVFQYIDRPIQQGAQVVPMEAAWAPAPPASRSIAGIVQLDAPASISIACQAKLNQSAYSRMAGTAWFAMVDMLAGLAELEPYASIACTAELEPYASIACLASFDGPARFAGICNLEAAGIPNLLSHISILDATSLELLSSEASLTWGAVSQISQEATLDMSASEQISNTVELDAPAAENIAGASDLEASGGAPLSQTAEVEASILEGYSGLAELEALTEERSAGISGELTYSELMSGFAELI